MVATLGHTGNSFELIAEIPVLNAAQIRQAALMAMVYKGIFIDPTRTSGIRADHGMNALGQTSCICCMYSKTRERAQYKSVPSSNTTKT